MRTNEMNTEIEKEGLNLLLLLVNPIYFFFSADRLFDGEDNE